MDTAPFILELKATPEEVMRGVESLQEFCRARDVDEKSIHALMLGLEEIASNVVNHAFGGGDALQNFRLSFRHADDRVVVEVRDSGPAFDPLQSNIPAWKGDEDERPEGSWGIELVRHSMDDLSYAREGNENVLTMSRNLKPGTA